MKDTQKLICIVCPMGCHMEVSKEGEDYKVTGNTCKRGEAYALREMTNPTRVLTSTVKIKNGLLNRLPVRTSDDIPKPQLFEAMKLINAVEITAPIQVGDIIIPDILDTGINVIASRSMAVNPA